MEKIIIAAIFQNNVIGNKGKIPWHISEDLKRFRKLTLGSPIIMGRKTYESIGKPLDNRVNLVLSKKEIFRQGVIICHSIKEALKKAEKYGERVYISGGEEIYRQTIDLVDKLELTKVNRYVKGNSFFPNINYNQWEEIFQEEHKDFSFHTYKRIKEK